MVLRKEVFMKKPNLFIVGAPRSGTTSMYHYLNQHPDIYMSKVKEPHFFATDLSAPTKIHQNYRKKENYLALFNGHKNEKYLGEASVYYLYSKDAVKNIYKFNPKSKIIIMLRSPVDAIASLYITNRFSGQEHLDTLEEALTAEAERKKGNKLASNLNFLIESFLYKEVFKYYQQVKRCLDIFPRENVHIVFFDEFSNNTQKEYLKILSFLKVSKSFMPEFRIYNKGLRPKHPRLQKLISNYITHPLQVSGLIKLIPEKLMYEIKSYVGRESKSLVMNKKLEAKLKKEFKKDIKKLEELLDKDLSFWYTY